MELNDQATFEAHAERHRRELQLHCYRMLGSLEEGAIADITSFTSAVFPAFGLPAKL